jgi:hypothetical protein
MNAMWSELADFNPNTLARQDILMTQKMEITFEVEETITVKQGGKILIEICPRCGQETELASPEVIALATGASEREIFRLMETGQIYFVEADRVYACTRCLFGPRPDNDLPKLKSANKEQI